MDHIQSISQLLLEGKLLFTTFDKVRMSLRNFVEENVKRIVGISLTVHDYGALTFLTLLKFKRP